MAVPPKTTHTQPRANLQRLDRLTQILPGTPKASLPIILVRGQGYLPLARNWACYVSTTSSPSIQRI